MSRLRQHRLGAEVGLTRDDELEIRRAAFPEQGTGLNESFEVLPAIETSEGKDEAGPETVAPEHPGRGVW